MKYLFLAFLSLPFMASCAPAEPEPASSTETASPAAGVPDGTRQNPFTGHGVIQEVGEGELVIEHGMIPGFMAAMTMAFPVADDLPIADLAVGDEIDFHIELLEDGYQVFDVEGVPGN